MLAALALIDAAKAETAGLAELKGNQAKYRGRRQLPAPDRNSKRKLDEAIIGGKFIIVL